MRAIKPVYIKYTSGTMTQCYDIVPWINLAIMNLCLFDFSFEVVELPTFLPNDYLFTKHASKVGQTP
jgi:hypothetical protein